MMLYVLLERQYSLLNRVVGIGSRSQDVHGEVKTRRRTSMLWALPKIDVAMAVVGSAQNRLCYDGTQQ